MATSISFTDDEGAATLTNGKSYPGDRFDAWTPFPVFNGEAAHELGSKRRHSFKFGSGSIYGARFQLSKIPAASTEIAQRLVEHLLDGGTCTVATGDSANRTYTTCSLAEGTEPALEPSDRTEREYTLSLALINTAVSPTRMICTY